jgi:thiamine kinase-like enzyme
VNFDQQCWDALARLKPNWRLPSVNDIEFLDGGYSNRNYRLSYEDACYVIRVVAERETSLAINRAEELALLNGAIAKLAPPLEAFVLPEGHMLTVHMDGPLLVDAAPSPAQLAAYLAHLHGALQPFAVTYDLPDVVAGYLRVAKRHGADVHPRAVEVLSGLTPVGPGMVPCHNDLNPWNIIASSADPRGWCTLDWELAGNNDPLFDLLALSGGLASSPAEEQALIEGYFALVDRPLPKADVVNRTRNAFALREYAWALCQESLGNRRGEVIEQRETSLEQLISARL